jgi:hypothetical protein
MGPVIHGESVECEKSTRHSLSTRGRWFAGLLLIGYVSTLCILGVIGRRQDPGQAVRSFELQDLLQPFDWTVVVAVDGLVEVAKFLVVGLLVSLAFRRLSDPCSFRALLVRRISLLLLGVGLSIVVCGMALGGPVHPLLLVLPLAGFLLGAWIGSAWLDGYRAAFWLVPKLGLILLLLAGCVVGLVFLALDDAPLPFEVPRVTSAEKRRLVEVLSNRPKVEEEVQQLELSGRDVNSLLAIAMTQGPLDGKARVVIEQGGFSAELSLETPFRSSAFRYINFQGACRIEVTSGHLELIPERLRIGRLTIPKFAQDACVPPVVATLLEDPDLARGVALIDSLRLTPGAGRMVYQSGDYGRNNIHSLLAKLLQKPDVRMETEIHIRHLVDAAKTLPEGEGRFVAFVQTAFEFAGKRSQNRDPVMENRGAIMALAILLGHRQMEKLVGPVTDNNLRQQARRSVGRVTLRDRRDWTKHFFVSAGLTLLSNDHMSDGAGLFKEEYDAGEGGSGFSFADLLADRAGTQFALAATRDARSARKMQERLSAGFLVEDVFPDANDLPEGIPDAEFQSVYGGVGGERYGQVVAEIERRLGKCAALRARY